MIRKRTTLTTSERKQRLFLLLFGIILCGACGGVLWNVLHRQGMPTAWSHLAGIFFETERTLPALCTEAVSGAVMFLFCLFFLGFSAIGQPGVFLTLLGYGLCMGGALSTQCVGEHSVLYRACLLPYYVPLSVLMVLSAREALRFSGLFTAFGFRDDPADNMHHHFQLYCARFVVLLIFLPLLSVVYSLAFYMATTRMA